MNLRNNGQVAKDGTNILQYFEKHRAPSSFKETIKNEISDPDPEDPSGCCCSEAQMNKICWAEPDQEQLPFAFCRDTSLHGLKYIGQAERHLFERIFWFAAFLTGVTMACYLINGVWEKFSNSPVIVSFQETDVSIFQIPFPAVTICNVNNVLRSKAKEYIDNEEKKKLDLTEHVCGSAAQSFSQKLGFHDSRNDEFQKTLQRLKSQDAPKNESTQNGDVKNFLIDAAQTCPRMILKCMWEDTVVNCTDIFQPIETDFGKCCSFNMVPLSLLLLYENDTRDKEEVVEYWSRSDMEMGSLLLRDRLLNDGIDPKQRRPRRLRRSGKSYGLSILLDPELNEYFCTAADSDGFQLTTHLPIDVPHVVDNGVSIQPNHETYIRVTPDVTTAADSVESIALEKRGCYFHGEYSLKFYKYYSVSNCFDECIANLTNKECQCVRYYMPRESNGTLCGPSKFACTKTIKKKYTESGFASDCTRCLPTCTEILYSTEMSVSPLRQDVDIWMLDGDQTSKTWSKKNLSIVHIYFGEDSMYPKIRKELYGITDLIANTGGLLGLCLGFSVLSLLEVVYFLTIRAWFKARLRRKALKRVANKVVGIWQRLRGRLTDPVPEEDNRVLPFVTQVEYLTTWKENTEKSKQNIDRENNDVIVGEVAPYYMNRKSLGMISSGKMNGSVK